MTAQPTRRDLILEEPERLANRSTKNDDRRIVRVEYRLDALTQMMADAKLDTDSIVARNGQPIVPKHRTG